MDKNSKKQMRQQWQAQQRASARDAFPVPPAELKALFEFLNLELPRSGCDHSRRLTETWIRNQGHDAPSVLAWLNAHGGFCDREVLANCEPSFEETLRDA